MKLDEGVHLLAQRNREGEGGAEEIASQRTPSRFLTVAASRTHSAPTLYGGLVGVLIGLL